MMRTAVIVLAPDPRLDALGGDVTQYVSAGTFKGRLRTLTGREAEMSGSEGVHLTHKLYARPGVVTSALTESLRLQIGAAIFEIDHINDVDQAGRLLEITLMERRPNRYG